MYIILGEDYISYSNALEILETDRLSDRRYKLCENFVKKSQKHPKYQNWFAPNKNQIPFIQTRNEKVTPRNMFNPVKTRTDRYLKSPLPYLTDILNKLMTKKQ